MAILDELVTQIENPDLRARIAAEVEKLAKQKKFGLVFEEHLPECTPLWDIPVKAGRKAALKTGHVNDFYTVLKIEDGVATCLNKDKSATAEFPVEELVCVAEFGEPIYPYLKPIDTVCNAPDSDLWHTLIEADNYHALQLLEYLYAGKVDCIYIDPPYNTGNEGWVYNDNVNDPKILRWLGELVGKAGEDLTRHDKWLCMMYPRLKLLYKLLSDDGAIFISLDDNEIFYLRSIMDEIFGASNFTAQITLLCNPKGRSQDKYFATCHEYLLVYTKSAVPAGWFSVEKDDAKIEKDYKLSDAGGKYRLLELRNTHREFGKENRPNLWYPIYANADDGTVSLEKDEQHNIEIYPTWPDGYEGCWTWGTELASKSTQLLVAQKKAGAWKIYRKSYAATDGETVRQKLFTIWNNPQFFTEKGQVAFGQIFPGANKNDFPQPKSVEYVMEAIRTITHDDDIVLDSFAGSGTTGQAVLNLNSDGGHRKFILVEMMDYADSITAERVKRVIKGYGEGKNAVEGTGGNFSFYDLGEPLLVGDYLNEAVAPEKIREYIWFMETKQPYAPPSGGNPYYLGKHNSTGYYFYYEPQRVTVLDYAFLSTITEKADGTVIYADRCSISEDKLAKMGVTFKKIPRDISRL